MFENTGTVALDITEATSQFGDSEPMDLLEFIIPTNLGPGGEAQISATRRIDFCIPENVVATVSASATSANGPCEAQATYDFIPMPNAGPSGGGGEGGGGEGGGRSLRGN